MGTTAQKLQAILDSKLDIKDAIEAKGVTVGDAPFDEYANKIGEINSGGSEEAPENDVNFYDYDGRRIASYTIAEAKALTELPTPPSHVGLTFQEWNWTLEDIKTYDRQYADIGANYVTSDGKTHLFACVSDTNVVMSFNGKNGTMTVNWGDGNTDSYTFSSSFTNHSVSHTYTQAGANLDISVEFTQSSNDGGYRINNKGGATTTGWMGLFITEVRFGNYVIIDNDRGLQCWFDSNTLISIPKSTLITKIDCIANFINTLVIPRNSAINFTKVQGSIAHIIFPKDIGNFGANGYSFYQTSVNRLVVPTFTNSSALHINTFVTLNCVIISIPIVTSFAAAGNQLNFGNLKYIDIPQGWIPNVSMTLNSSTRWSATDLVRFFTNLGTTTNAITLTFGSTNLNKLTAEQKAIATDKGYTLA